ncbi:hypothetical protein AYI68_g5804 [Smittium mucronatum]|uniref:Secreted protein n=1 Tax=Smittium mucronatum TaxID=133383 RepID=A0A1R0GTD7_9FUNG|nr:hypothetical protein AYI68_g5804 [Smittium mucronatum]
MSAQYIFFLEALISLISRASLGSGVNGTSTSFSSSSADHAPPLTLLPSINLRYCAKYSEGCLPSPSTEVASFHFGPFSFTKFLSFSFSSSVHSLLSL